MKEVFKKIFGDKERIGINSLIIAICLVGLGIISLLCYIVPSLPLFILTCYMISKAFYLIANKLD